VGVSYATSNDAAVAGKDYTATSGTLSWANRDLAAKYFTVTILDDARDEATEAFRVALSAPTGGAALGTWSVARVVIQDNDPAGTPRFFATLNMAVPAREFSEIGGFRPDFRTSEDREFCARWLQRGHRMIYVPEAMVVHKSLVGLRGFWRRHYHYGIGAYRFRSLQAKHGDSAMVLAPAGFYWHLIRYPLAKKIGLREIAVSFLIMISQIASLFGFMMEWRRGK